MVFTITITDAAAVHLKKQMDKAGEGQVLRLAIKGTGCGGNSYDLKYADLNDVGSDDVLEDNGVALYVPVTSSWMLDKTVIDYIADGKGIEQKLVFNNPQAAEVCGCGESFTVQRPKLEDPS